MQSKYKVLICHNSYQQKGGEDTVVDSEIKLLQENGHDVQVFSRHNDDIEKMSHLHLVVDTFWSSNSAAMFAAELDSFKPDVIHVHNTFPLVSPAIYWVAARYQIPVVQTLHNFRLFCPQAMFLREDKVCEDCLGCLPWRGAIRGCYRNSVLQSSVLASMISVHRLIGTWQNKVTRYIALNKFCREKFIDGGLPANKVVIKANFVDFPQPSAQLRQGFLFVGRLSAEKGIDVFAKALEKLSTLNVRVAGIGPDDACLNKVPVTRLGALTTDQVRHEMSSAIALVLPSIWYENFPRTLVEAFGCGLPVIASKIGALAELIEDGVTGLLFEPGNSEDLAIKLQWAADHPDQMKAMGDAARMKYEASYTAEHNYDQLIAIYEEAITEVNKGKACNE